MVIWGAPILLKANAKIKQTVRKLAQLHARSELGFDFGGL